MPGGLSNPYGGGGLSNKPGIGAYGSGGLARRGQQNSRGQSGSRGIAKAGLSSLQDDNSNPMGIYGGGGLGGQPAKGLPTINKYSGGGGLSKIGGGCLSKGGLGSYGRHGMS